MQLILPVSGCGTNASVRIASNPFPARAPPLHFQLELQFLFQLRLSFSLNFNLGTPPQNVDARHKGRA
jgi:hypothetical protein